MRTLLGAAFHAVLIVTSAASAMAQRAAPLPCPPSAGDETGALGRPLLTFVEVDETGRERRLCKLARAAVDVNSVVYITPDLRALVSPTGPLSVRSPRIDSLAARLDSIVAMLRHLVDSLPSYTRQIDRAAREGRAAEASRRAAQTAARRPGVSPDERRRAEAAEQQAQAEVERLRRLHARALGRHAALLSPVTATVRAFDPAAYRAALAQPDPTYSAVGALLRRYLDALDAQLTETIRETLSRQPTRYSVRMWAVRYSPGRAPTQVHLDGYDNLPAGDPSPIDKLAYARTPEEDYVIDQATRLNRNWASLINEARDSSRTFAEVLERRARTALQHARQTIALLDSLPTPNDLDSLRSALADTAVFAGIRQHALNAKAALAPVAPIRTVLRSVRDSLDRGPSPVGGVDLLVRHAQALRAPVDSLVRNPNAVTALAQTLKALDSAAASFDDTASANREKAAEAQALTRRWVDAGARLAESQDSLRAFADLVGSLAQTVSALSAVGSASTQQSAALIRELITRGAQDAGPATLDIQAIDRREGDHVVVTFRVFGEDPAVTFARSEYRLAVRTFGWHRRWSGGLGFANQEGDGTRGFDAGPTVSYLLHYGMRPESDKTGKRDFGRQFWDFLNPGLGFTSIVLSRDQNLQFGIGPSASVFADLVQVGYGYNLQREKWYFLLNTALLDLILRAGGREPSVAAAGW